jgi:hypothetical protein
LAIAATIDHLLRRKQWFGMSFWSKHMAEDFLFNRHSFFDPDIWSKVVKTDARRKFQRKARKLARKYLAKAVDEIASAPAKDKHPSQ